MNQTRIIFSDGGDVKQTRAATKCFEAVSNDFDFKPIKSEETEKARKRFFADAAGRENILVPTFDEALRDAPLFPAARNRPPELSDTLLFYLDQIIYLEEISESLEKLNGAIESGNAARINLIAGECAGISRSCGMFAALKPLKELERVEHKNQMTNAESLSRRVGEEFERFKVTLKENLEQIK